MIQHLKNHQIDYAKWDKCIYAAYNSRIYAQSWYLDIVAPEWDALVWNDYEAVMPILLRKKMGINYCSQPLFTQQLGVFTNQLLTPSLLQHFVQALKPISRLTQINFNQNNLFPHEYAGISLMRNHEMDLYAPYQYLQQGYSKNTKRNIKKAEKHKIFVSTDPNVEAVITLFRRNKGQMIKQWDDVTYQLLARLMRKAIEYKQAEVWTAYTAENDVCAGAFFVFDQRRCTFLFSGTNTTAKATGAMSFLIDKFIQAHALSEKILDFEGSNDNNLARFYSSFGAQPIHYPHLFLNRLPWYIALPWQLKNRRR